MPKKIRELKAMLAKAGFSRRPGKRGHSVWEHPTRPALRVVVSGNDGHDARRYQEKQVKDAFREVEGRA
jgi:hypothetical protein